MVRSTCRGSLRGRENPPRLPWPLLPRRDALDLEAAAAQERARADERARREAPLEVGRVGAVEEVVEREVGAEDRHLHEVVHAEAGELELLPEVVEHRAHLLLGVRGRLACRGVHAERAGDEVEAAGEDAVAEGQCVGAAGEVHVLDAVLGRRAGGTGSGAGARDEQESANEGESGHSAHLSSPGSSKAAVAGGRSVPFSHRSSHPITFWCQKRLFSGFSTQWFSSGKYTNFEGM